MSTAREVLKAADDLRHRAAAMESIRRNIRLGKSPRSILGRIFIRGERIEYTFTDAETAALYEWCGIRRDELSREAEQTESRLTVESAGSHGRESER